MTSYTTQAVPTAISPSDLGQDLRGAILNSEINTLKLTDEKIDLYATVLNELGVKRLSRKYQSGEYTFEGQVLDYATVYQIANLMVERYRDIKNNDTVKDFFKNELAKAIKRSEKGRPKDVGQYISDIVESQFPKDVAMKVYLLEEPE